MRNAHYHMTMTKWKRMLSPSIEQNVNETEGAIEEISDIETSVEIHVSV